MQLCSTNVIYAKMHGVLAVQSQPWPNTLAVNQRLQSHGVVHGSHGTPKLNVPCSGLQNHTTHTYTLRCQQPFLFNNANSPNIQTVTITAIQPETCNCTAVVLFITFYCRCWVIPLLSRQLPHHHHHLLQHHQQQQHMPPPLLLATF